MSDLYFGVAVFLLMNVLVSMVRILRGPSPADRMLAAQLFGTTGVAVMLLLAEAYERPAIRTVGLVFAVLAVIATSVFVRQDSPARNGQPSRAPQ